MLEHGGGPLEVSAFDKHAVAADAARRLVEVGVEAVNDSHLLLVCIERLLGTCQVQVAEFDRTKREGSWHLLREGLSEFFWVVQVIISVLTWLGHLHFLLLFFLLGRGRLVLFASLLRCLDFLGCSSGQRRLLFFSKADDSLFRLLDPLLVSSDLAPAGLQQVSHSLRQVLKLRRVNHFVPSLVNPARLELGIFIVGWLIARGRRLFFALPLPTLCFDFSIFAVETTS